MTPARFRWGMLLIQIGILILLQNNNIISENTWENLFVYFPLVLIAVGIEKIFTKSKLQFISYLTTIALFFGGFAIAVVVSNSAFHNDNFFTDSIYKEELDPDVQMIRANLILDGNNLTIRDSGPELILAEFDEFSKKPEILSSVDDNIANISMTARENTFFGGAVKINNDNVDDWYIQFSEETPLELECTGQDNDIHLNFLNTLLRKLSLITDNTNIYLKIGSQEPLVQINVEGEDSKLRLRVPEKSGLKIISHDDSYFQKLGFLKTDDGNFESQNYKTATEQIELELDDNLVSFSLDYY